MSGATFSQYWYRVADLKVRLRAHVALHRHVYRGQVWYVLQDHVTGQYHRFTPEAYRIIGLLDGERTLDDVWESACVSLGDEMPTQDELIDLVARLHRANVLQSSLPPDVEEMVERGRKVRRARWLQQLRSPLGVRIPALDPERFLSATDGVGRLAFSWFGAILWLVVVTAGVVQAAVSWDGLTNNLADRLLTLENLVLLSVVYPVVKAIHELGHGYAVKRWGGEVHEMGIMLLVFMPVPYVDASASASFGSKWQRALVGAAGILTEVFIAAVAMLVWAAVEPGAVRAVAFNVMLIAGVSTVMFNGNPLLRFDAYYVMSDLLEIPNMANRGNAQVGYAMKRFLYGVRDAISPADSLSEACWLFTYSIASFAYRVFIMFAITLFVASKYLFAGVVLALWSIFGAMILPLFQTINKALHDGGLRAHPLRSLAITALIVGVPAMLLAMVPAPLSTYSHGVVWPVEEARVRAGAEGFVTRIAVESGDRVEAGEALVEFEDPEIEAELRVLDARIAEAQARAQAARENLAEAVVIQEEIRYLERERENVDELRQLLTLRSPRAGIAIVPGTDDLPGRYVRRGDQLAYVVDYAALTLRVPVSQGDIDLVRNHTEGVEVRFASDLTRAHAARVRALAPAATTMLASPVLTVDGGGLIARNPEADAGLESFQPYFQLDLEVPGVEKRYVEERAHVVFRHPPEPLAFRWYRGIRRVLLSQFDV